MQRFLVISLCTIILFISACKENKPKALAKEIIPRVVLASSPLSPVFEQLRPNSQIMMIKGERDTVIRATKGTLISIPRNCFVDKEGNEVKGPVKLEIIEALNPGDFIAANLHTTSGGRILESGGMMYIDATVNGQPIAIANGKELQVQIPASSKDAKMQLFTGSIDKSGQMDWRKAGEQDNDLIPLPLKELNYYYYKRLRIYLDNKGGQRDSKHLDSVSLNDAKYENTYVATEEFRDRLLVASGRYWGYYDRIWPNQNSLKDIKRGYCDHIKEMNILNIYLNNTDKPLHTVDSLALTASKKLCKEDSIQASKSEESRFKWFGYYEYNYYLYDYFFKQKPGRVKKYNDRGVNMASTNAYDQLIAKEVSPSEASEQLLLYQQRNDIIKAMHDRKEAAKMQQQASMAIEKASDNAFKVKSLGWVNCDRFLDDPSAKPVKLDLIVNNTDTGVFTNTFILIPNRNIALNGHQDGASLYHFTKSDSMYKKLPVGEKAIIIAIGYSRTKKLYWATKEITIKPKQDIAIDLKEQPIEGLQQALAKMK